MNELLFNPLIYFTMFAVFAKALCGYRLYQYWNNKRPEIIACLGFLLLFYAKGVLELYGYWMRVGGEVPVLSMKIYYVLFGAGIVSMPLLMHVVITRSINVIYLVITLITITAVATYTLMTNYIVLGVEPIKYTFTAVRGEYYFVFQALSVSVLLLSAFLPLSLYKRIKTEQSDYILFPNKKRRAIAVRAEGYEAALVRCANFMSGILPYSIFVMLVIVLMAFDLRINIAGVSPLFMTLFIYMLSENIRSDKISDSRRWYFWTDKAKQIRRVTEPFRNLKLENLESDGRKLTTVYQKELIDTASKLFPIAQKDQAAYLGMTASKLCRIKQNSD